MRYAYALLFSLAVISCGTGVDDVPYIVGQVTRPLDVDLDHDQAALLATGYLGLNEEFSEISPVISYTHDGSQSLFQVKFELLDIEKLAGSLDFLRVEFTSDNSEWVASGSGDIGIYDNELDCLETGYHCDEVEIASGTSGYFKYSENSYGAFQNAYCRSRFDHDGNYVAYTYNVSAVLYDISVYPAAQLTSHHNIEITCIPDTQ